MRQTLTRNLMPLRTMTISVGDLCTKFSYWLTTASDIYGSADAKAEALSADHAARVAAATRSILAIEVCHSLPAYGPIRSATLGGVEADAPQELVACTGDDQTGGLTILHVRALLDGGGLALSTRVQRSILPAKRQRIKLDHATESVWSMRIKQTEGELEYKTYLFTSSEGETQVSHILPAI